MVTIKPNITYPVVQGSTVYFIPNRDSHRQEYPQQHSLYNPRQQTHVPSSRQWVLGSLSHRSLLGCKNEWTQLVQTDLTNTMLSDQRNYTGHVCKNQSSLCLQWCSKSGPWHPVEGSGDGRWGLPDVSLPVLGAGDTGTVSLPSVRIHLALPLHMCMSTCTEFC